MKNTDRIFEDCDEYLLGLVRKKEFDRIHGVHEFDMVPAKDKITLHPSMNQAVTIEYCEDYSKK